MSFIKDFPHTSIYDKDLGWLIRQYKELNDNYEVLKDIYNIVKEQIHDVTIAQLQEWLNDGTLENIINDGLLNNVQQGMIRSEEDFTKFNNVNNWVLMNDVILTKPIENAFDISRDIDLNGFTLKVDSNYKGDCIFKIGENADFSIDKNIYKCVHNGVIDCRNSNTCVFKIKLAWRLFVNDIHVKNCNKGLINYLSSEVSKGAECSLSNITLEHGSSLDASIGLHIDFGDSWFNNIAIVGFHTGVKITKSSNVLDKIHVWGYPFKSTGTLLNMMTRIGFVVFSQKNILNNCISDTVEPVDSSLSASYSNGGVGFYVCGIDLQLNRCSDITHPDSIYKKHVAYWFADTHPETLLKNYLLNNSILNSYATQQNSDRTFPSYEKVIIEEKPILMVGNNFSINNVNNNGFFETSSALPASSTYFKNSLDFSNDYKLFTYIPDKLMFKLSFIGNVMTFFLKDKTNKLNTSYLQPSRNLRITSKSELGSLKQTLIAEKTTYGTFLTSYVYTVIYVHDSYEDLLFWDSSNNKFFNARTGVEEITT